LPEQPIAPSVPPLGLAYRTHYKREFAIRRNSERELLLKKRTGRLGDRLNFNHSQNERCGMEAPPRPRDEKRRLAWPRRAPVRCRAACSIGEGVSEAEAPGWPTGRMSALEGAFTRHTGVNADGVVDRLGEDRAVVGLAGSGEGLHRMYSTGHNEEHSPP